MTKWTPNLIWSIQTFPSGVVIFWHLLPNLSGRMEDLWISFHQKICFWSYIKAFPNRVREAEEKRGCAFWPENLPICSYTSWEAAQGFAGGNAPWMWESTLCAVQGSVHNLQAFSYNEEQSCSSTQAFSAETEWGQINKVFWGSATSLHHLGTTSTVSWTEYKETKWALFTLSSLISSTQLWEVSVIKGEMAQACDY